MSSQYIEPSHKYTGPGKNEYNIGNADKILKIFLQTACTGNAISF